MTNYLTHMQSIGKDTAFPRRLSYLAYNFKPYLKILNRTSRILEIGPGTGELLSLLNSMGITKIDIVDNDPSVLKYCQTTYKIETTIHAKSLDMGKTIPKNVMYDLITLTQVFEHIPKSSYLNWIRTLYTHLNPGGHLVITVPNGANPLVGTERYGDLQHENVFTIFSFGELMTFAGLPDSSYKISGFEIPPSSPINLIRIVLQKILHAFFILIMIINGAIYQTLMTPNITLVITKKVV